MVEGFAVPTQLAMAKAKVIAMVMPRVKVQGRAKDLVKERKMKSPLSSMAKGKLMKTPASPRTKVVK
jgi:hypothetical protein